jgi:hypothetical protein
VTAAYRSNDTKSPTKGWRRKLITISATNTSNRQKFANVANISVAFQQCFLQFLPGFALRIENDVTYSKQRTAHFLPGATTTCQSHRVFSKIADSIPSPLVICSALYPAKTLRNAGARTAVSGPQCRQILGRMRCRENFYAPR